MSADAASEDTMSTFSVPAAVASNLSYEELLTKAQELEDKLKLEKAVALYYEGIKRFPNDHVLLDCYTDLLI